MSNNAKIDSDKLRQIIKEEITILSEQLDHAGIRDVVTGASKFLAAVEAFEASASDPMKNAMVPHLDTIKKTLEDMVSTPGSYVAKPKKVPQKVSLRKSKDV